MTLNSNLTKFDILPQLEGLVMHLFVFYNIDHPIVIIIL